MENYRLYLLDPSGHIARVQPLEAEDDESARHEATFIASDKSWELWSGARVVARSIAEAAKNKAYRN
jgi:hypothetical protein